ncbi:uncharacterized protein LOC124352790 [Homalodisca vitripennis]|uniref:uncharacterized protein LOC124352790 n=1 Tax=Homalodisca vitripennis TaxID=197043 RepID=UPI001EEB96B8|nr:uncharacterized protein LOC124352790 [Homalodisca vitripennis]KAG8257614.1 hypothetical protein J6590_045075 [Homalodisca vitripennis]
MPVGGRVAGKSGVVGRVGEGHGVARINEDIIWMTICVGIIILVLISLALCYILHEKCKKRKGSWERA